MSERAQGVMALIASVPALLMAYVAYDSRIVFTSDGWWIAWWSFFAVIGLALVVVGIYGITYKEKQND